MSSITIAFAIANVRFLICKYISKRIFEILIHWTWTFLDVYHKSNGEFLTCVKDKKKISVNFYGLSGFFFSFLSWLAFQLFDKNYQELSKFNLFKIDILVNFSASPWSYYMMLSLRFKVTQSEITQSWNCTVKKPSKE